MNLDTYSYYWYYINKCVRQVQEEISLGNLTDEDSIISWADSVGNFLNPCEAFKFFGVDSPYEWNEFLTADQVVACNCNLAEIAVDVEVGMYPQ